VFVGVAPPTGVFVGVGVTPGTVGVFVDVGVMPGTVGVFVDVGVVPGTVGVFDGRVVAVTARSTTGS
jgi:hypothetical protein